MQKAALAFGIKYCLPEDITQRSRVPRAAQEAARLLCFSASGDNVAFQLFVEMLLDFVLLCLTPEIRVGELKRSLQESTEILCCRSSC